VENADGFAAVMLENADGFAAAWGRDVLFFEDAV
jgi:hypothetical protein